MHNHTKTTLGSIVLSFIVCAALVLSGCQTSPVWNHTGNRLTGSPTGPLATHGTSGNLPLGPNVQSAGGQPQINRRQISPGFESQTHEISNAVARIPDRGSYPYPAQAIAHNPANQSSAASQVVYRSQNPQDSGVRHTAYQFPETGSNSAVQSPSITTGSPNEPGVLPNTYAPSGVGTFPMNYTDQNFANLDVVVGETQTGRINFGGAYNSDNGIVGQFIIDERNFDITALPRSFQDILDGNAFRGAGQTFRLELVPGAEVQRYLVSFGEPYLFNTNVSLNLSAYLFDRRFFDWDEERLGGRLALGYRLTPDLSVSVGVRMENVEISDPRVGTSPQLNEVVGDTDLYVGHVSLIRDTRDHPFLATEGSYLSMTWHQGFGEFDYPRGDIDFRRYRLLYQRPDGSGRHTLSYGTKIGVSGTQTPVFENYFAGGFSSMRGFDFRGASPVEGGVRVGGAFQWLNTLEYMFPLTADDMIKGVLFCDFGTVEDTVRIDSEDFRVAPGLGLRVHMPAMGIGAPLAFDFAFPVMESEFDEKQVFSFYLGVLR